MKQLMIFIAFIFLNFQAIAQGGPVGQEGLCYCNWFWGPNSQTGEIGRLSSIKVNSPGTGFIVNGAETNASSWGGPWYGMSRGTFDLGYLNQGSSVLLQGFYGIGFRSDKGTMTINQNGAVTIGLTDSEILENSQTPVVPYKLYVKGGIRTDKVQVDLINNWPDYVFDSNYELMPLHILKQFINDHKHLPGIPSAEEMSQEGMDLAKMNTILLEKIEELTLHVLKLNEEIEDLKLERKINRN
jgi:hypothetical protein